MARKKKYVGLLVILTLILLPAGYLAYEFFIAPSANISGINLIPKNALLVIETNDPLGNWKQIYENPVWKKIHTNKHIKSLDTTMKSVDTLVSNTRILDKLVSQRTVLVSLHKIQDDHEPLIIADLKNIGKINEAINLYLQKTAGDHPSYKYDNIQVNKVYDKEEDEYTYLALIENQLLISFNETLIKMAIEQQARDGFMKDDPFVELAGQQKGKGLARFYINYEAIRKSASSNPEQDKFLKYLGKSLDYSGMHLELEKNGSIMIEGHTNLDSLPSYFHTFHESGNGPIRTDKIAPGRTSFMMTMGFDNFIDFHQNLRKNLENDPETYEETLGEIEKVENYFKINLEEHIFSWIDDEIAILQIKPVLNYKDAELAVAFVTNSRGKARDNMEHVIKKINRRTPGLKFKAVNYQGYDINYLSIPGLFKVLFGNLLGDDMEKPYFAIIDDYVVFSNHPQTIKSLIDDYEAGSTLANQERYNDFMSNFSRLASVSVYIDMNNLYPNLKSYIGHKTLKEIKNNKDYLGYFPRIGFQLSNQKSHFETYLMIDFDEEGEIPGDENIKRVYLPEEAVFGSFSEEDLSDTLQASEVQIDDLDIHKYEEFYNNGQLKLEVKVSKGLKDGNFKEYYPDGSIKVKGKFRHNARHGTWTYYDMEGNEVKVEEYDEGEWEE